MSHTIRFVQVEFDDNLSAIVEARFIGNKPTRVSEANTERSAG